MNKKFWIILILILCVLAIVVFFFSRKHTPSNNYEANKTSTNKDEINTSENFASKANNTSSNNENIDVPSNENVENTTKTTAPPPVEEIISTYSTKIYSTDSARQNNINITCNTLNGTIVKNGETFSFCNTVGQASSNKGYQKADIFDKDGNKKKGLGRWKLPNK